MEFFDYRGTDMTNGKARRGSVTGATLRDAKQTLQDKGIKIDYVEPMRDVFDIRKNVMLMTTLKVKKRDKKDFVEQLAFMLETNIPLYTALITLRDKSEGKAMPILARPLCESVRKGAALHTAMKDSGYFEESVVQQVRAGENSGNVVDALNDIAEQMTENMEFTAKIRGAAVYPIMISIVMVLVLWILLTFVVPSIAETINQMGGELPGITRFVISVSKSMKYITIVLAVTITAGVIVYKRLRKNNISFRITVDKYKLKIPIIGRMLKKIAFKEFTKQLAVMQKSGITLSESMEIVKRTVKNAYIQEAVSVMEKAIDQRGVSLAAAMASQSVFEPIMVEMVTIGTDTGQVPEVLEKLSYRYKTEVEQQLKVITSMMEPIMIAVIGVVVGFVMIAMYMPMMSLVDAVKT